jgi:hypothetical protein
MIYNLGTYEVQTKQKVGNQIMKRTIIPTSFRDRFGAILGILALLFFFVAIYIGEYWLALFLAFLAVYFFVIVYGFQDQVITKESANEYEAVIETVLKMSNQLSILSKFLEKEQARISDTEATIKRLSEEERELEPLVLEKREVVDAILNAHSARTARYAWKERLFGFILGVISSLIASFVYEQLK